MQELIEAFRQEMLKQLEEITRKERHDRESEIIDEILNQLSIDDPTQVINYVNYTQQEMFDRFATVSVNVNKYDFITLFVYEPFDRLNLNAFAGYSQDLAMNVLFVNLWKEGYKNYQL